ncbi:MAG TPA: three-Cys-motif partner protein TcmP [Anaerolineales bacterium]|nr:three-Cys-motif partner protein TcmP [Anaerolineales bacterium]
MADTKIASDGLPALVIKQHSLEKLFYFQRYIYQFTTALKSKFEERNYIDLFSGTGLCLVRETNEEANGSALLALTTVAPFSNYYFIDLYQEHLTSLESRANAVASAQFLRKLFFQGDCNKKVYDVLKHINKKYSVNLAILDGFGIECHWSTIESLSSCQRMDLIILFPQGMNINRNLKFWVESESNSLDLFFGANGWRKIYEQEHGRANQCIRPFLDLYQSNLRKLGYGGENQVREQLIRSQGGQKLYYLIFASRNPLGEKFWKQATDKTLGGQRKLKGF